jgi:predicted dinucleotide-binding enzyme
MRIAITGAGRVGKSLGTALRKKGHHVVYGAALAATRSPERIETQEMPGSKVPSRDENRSLAA